MSLVGPLRMYASGLPRQFGIKADKRVVGSENRIPAGEGDVDDTLAFCLLGLVFGGAREVNEMTPAAVARFAGSRTEAVSRGKE